MWVVNKRYLNDENFKAKRKVLQPFTPSSADSQILQDPDQIIGFIIHCQPFQ